MARNRNSNRRQRDNSSIAKSLLSPTLLPEIEDRRLFHPQDVFRPAKGLSKGSTLLEVRPVGDRTKRARGMSSPETIRFSIPNHVAICVRRKRRREVLFALGKTGKGSKKFRRRRNYYSGVNCK